jgi:hypothetical protein
MARLPNDLYVLDATVCACDETGEARAIRAGGELLHLAPQVTPAMVKPRDSVRVLIRKSPDGDADFLAVRPVGSNAVIPLGPRVGWGLLAAGSSLLVIAMLAKLYWLLAAPCLLAIVFLALYARRHAARRWFIETEATREVPSKGSTATRSVAMNFDIPWACPCKQARLARQRIARAASRALPTSTNVIQFPRKVAQRVRVVAGR